VNTGEAFSFVTAGARVRVRRYSGRWVIPSRHSAVVGA